MFCWGGAAVAIAVAVGGGGRSAWFLDLDSTERNA